MDNGQQEPPTENGAPDQPRCPRVRTWRTCSWCHTSNPLENPTCPTWGHDAHKPRLACTCPQCLPAPAADDTPG